MITLFDLGALEMLKAFFALPLTMRLYTVNVDLSDGTTTATLTEAAGDNYYPLELSPGDFSFSSIDGIPTASHPRVSFNFGGPLTGNPQVWGYYVTNAAGVAIYGAAKTVPFEPSEANDVLEIDPYFQLSYGVPA